MVLWQRAQILAGVDVQMVDSNSQDPAVYAVIH